MWIPSIPTSYQIVKVSSRDSNGYPWDGDMLHAPRPHLKICLLSWSPFLVLREDSNPYQFMQKNFKNSK